jgi:hypothetical protein
LCLDNFSVIGIEKVEGVAVEFDEDEFIIAG